MTRALRIAALLLGLGLFAWLVRGASPGDVARELAGLGAQGWLLLIPYAGAYVLDALGWRFAFTRTDARRIGFARLMRIRTAGEALNTSIPSATLGGEPVKIWLVTDRGVPALSAAQSVVVAKTTMTLAQSLFIAAGALAASRSLAPGSSVRTAMLATSLAAGTVVAGLFWFQHRGLFATLIGGMRALGLPAERWRRREATLAALDGLISGYYRNERARFVYSTTLHLAGWVVGALEVWLATALLGAPIEWTQALAIEAFVGVAKGAGAFAPGSIGIQESSIVLLFRVLGLADALGISYAILRRAREVLWIGLGLLSLAREQAQSRRMSTWSQPVRR